MKHFLAALSCISMLFLYSCVEKTENPGQTGVDYVKWTYNLNSIDNKEIVKAAIPAFDEENNGYYLIETDNTSNSDINNRNDVWLLSLRSDSTLHWKVKVSATTIDALDNNYVAYAEGKVLVFLKTSLVCVDTTSGSTLWNKTIVREYWKNSLSVSNGKLFYIDQTASVEKVKGFNLSNGAEICSLSINSGTSENVRGNHTIVAGNNLFVSASDINNSGQWLTKIFIYNITNISNSSTPVTYTLPTGHYPKNTLAATSASNLLFFMKNEGNTAPYNKYLISVSPTGTENWKVIVPDEASTIYVDAQDNIYCYTTDDNLLKYSNTGVLQKETDYSYPTVISNFEILENNTFFGKTGNENTGEEWDLFTVFNLSDGSIKSTKNQDYPYTFLEGNDIETSNKNELRAEDNASFVGSYQKTVDRNGNLIAVSRHKIYCINDFNLRLQEGAWAKEYANYGNTNSK